jgi:MFS family permease
MPAAREARAQANPGVAGLVIASCFGLLLISKGTVETFTVFLLPLIDAFAVPRGALTSIYSITWFIIGFAGPVVGALFDRFGPRWLCSFGLLLLAVGTAGASYASALWQIYLCIGLLVGLGAAALSPVLHTALVSRWFKEHFSLAMGAIAAANGIGMLIVVPLAQLLIEQGGWRYAYIVLGLGIAVLAALVQLLPWRRIGAGRIERGGSNGDSRPLPNWSIGAALRAPELWALFAVFFFTAAANFTVTVQLVVFLVDHGVAPFQAAATMGFVGMMTSAGMLLFGWLADRFGRRNTASLSFACTGGGIVALLLMPDEPSLLPIALFVAAFGIASGARQPIVSAAVAATFRGRNIGAIYGVVALGIGSGGALGAPLAGFLHDWTGGYQASLIFALFCVLGGVLPFWTVTSLRAR